MLHRCPHCGHRQSLLPPFKRRDVKYTYRFEEHVLVVEHADKSTSRYDATTVERAPKAP